MFRPRLVLSVAAVLTFGLSTLAPAAPASAATDAQKLAVLSQWSQTSVSSYNAWFSARQNQAAWAGYSFDWSTDYCSDSPDQPLGFDFRLPCARHDFGYRNYTRLNQFPANKDRIDSAFYQDLKRVCARYSLLRRAACNALAATYYEAVKLLGGLAVSPAAIERARMLSHQR